MELPMESKIAVSPEMAKKAVQTIKMLCVDMVQKAHSGHPGMPMGCADIAFVLWLRFLIHNPDDPSWINRDRFVLSAGHGSALLYTMLHLTGYPLSMEALKAFRQWGSMTPGHPEYGLTAGVETTTGPLGQGFANGIGMAIAAKMLASRLNRDGTALIDHTVYAICSDGDLMEGVSSEAASLAGHLGLDNIVYIYDDNRITIDGSTDLAFTEDRGKRFEAYGWFVQHIDGHDHSQIEEAIRAAKAETERPSLIVARTHIARGAPTLEDSSKSHGEPLGEQEIAQMKEKAGWPAEPFYIPEEVRELFFTRNRELQSAYRAHTRLMEEVFGKDAGLRALWEDMRLKRPRGDLEAMLLDAVSGNKPDATRNSSGKALQAAARVFPGLCGGSADLTPSNKTFLQGAGTIRRGDFSGRNLHFGVREHAMGSISNGVALYGGFIPYAGTFLVFADYMRPSIRLASLMGLQVIYVFTHDSIFVGEDGPTHQPVEQIASLRAIPGLVVIRPADPTETAAAWSVALRRTNGPTALCLTRQSVPVLDRSIYPKAQEVSKGAYVLSEARGAPEMIIIATGSEVHLALEVQSALAERGVRVRVVSMPSQELFEEQEASYKELVLPPAVTKRVVIEAAVPFGWERYLCGGGLIIGVERFGSSAPYKVLAERFGFVKEAVLERIEAHFGL